LQWDKFCEEVNPNKERYVRINPNLGYKPPRLDEKAKLKTVQHDTIRALGEERMTLKLRRVAYQLIASLFYFEKTSGPKGDAVDGYSCTGNPRIFLHSQTLAD